MERSVIPREIRIRSRRKNKKEEPEWVNGWKFCGASVKINGSEFRMVTDKNGEEAQIRKGDIYVGQSYGPPQILVAKKISREGRIITSTSGHIFEVGECVRVEMVD